MKKIIVLSLFDGFSGAKIALDSLKIPCTYYASEIDKYAIQVSQRHFPDVIRLGDVKNIKGCDLPPIDLLIAGFLCQDLSISKQNREGLRGQRSGLFWELTRILEETKPKYFLIENVASMSKENKQIITNTLGVGPIMINSALLTAQNRKRLYWANIPGVTQPEDKHIYLKNIIESGNTEQLKSYCVPSTYYKENVKSLIKRKKKGLMVIEKTNIRKLTPLECELLQGMSGVFTEGASNTQRYKMTGNGFTIPAISWILSFMKKKIS